jgi:hypothetical protein
MSSSPLDPRAMLGAVKARPSVACARRKVSPTAALTASALTLASAWAPLFRFERTGHTCEWRKRGAAL